MSKTTSWRQSALLLAAALGGAGVVLANRPAGEDVAPALAAPAAPGAPAALPAAAVSHAAPAAVIPPAAPACQSVHRLAEWELLSSAVGGYREPGFAVLHHPQRGTLTLAEGAVFDDGMVLQRVTPDGVQLQCGQNSRSLALETAAGAAPAMRSALPDPERAASN